jgi:hypothetical protein
MEGSTKIDPVLKAWIDNVMVPVMVREYLEVCEAAGDNVQSPNSPKGSSLPEWERLQ